MPFSVKDCSHKEYNFVELFFMNSSAQESFISKNNIQREFTLKSSMEVLKRIVNIPSLDCLFSYTLKKAFANLFLAQKLQSDPNENMVLT